LLIAGAVVEGEDIERATEALERQPKLPLKVQAPMRIG